MRARYLEQNVSAHDLHLSTAELADIDAVFPPDATAGTRYPEA